MLSFIIANIIRFSLITVRRSLYDDSTVKVITPPIPGKLLLKIWYRLKKLMQTLKPDLSAIIRTSVMLVMLQLIVFPNTVLLLWPYVSDANASRRVELLQEFTQRKTAAINKQISENNHRIQKLTAGIDTLTEQPGEVNLLLRKKEKERQLFLDENIILSRQTDSITTVWGPMYAATIEKAYFPVMTFDMVGKSPLFFPIEIALLCLMFYPFRQLKRLKKGKQFTYSLNSTAFYRGKVLDDYQKHLVVIRKHLDKFGVSSEYQGIWNDPPFCTTYRQQVTKKNFKPLSQLLKTEGKTPA